MKTLFINEQITSHLIVLINEEGENKGKFTKPMAMQMARESGLDLVQVTADVPPVCKIADYGKMKYKASKSEKHTHAPAQKEMWFHLKTAQHDVDRKVEQVTEWLTKQHKVLLGVELKGRERFDETQRKIAREFLAKLTSALSTYSAPVKLSEGSKETSIMVHPKNS